MYMATAMYPYYSPQQGMNIPTGNVQSPGVFPGYMFGFPGYPPISPVMPVWPNQLATMDPSMRAPYTPGMQGYAPRMMAMPSPEYAGYYHKGTDAQPSQQPPGISFRNTAHPTAVPQTSAQNESNLEKSKTDSEGESKGAGSFTWRTHSASSQSAEVYSRSLSDRERMSTSRIPENKRTARRERGRRRDSATSQSGAPPHKDSLLEEFKTNKSRRFEFRDILGHICEFSMDQHGSRFIQQKLDTLSGEELATVVAEVLPRSLALMQDVFGNYVVQKLLEHGTREQRSKLARAMEGQVLVLSLQMYGCRVVQKALELCSREEGIAMARELEGHVMKCVRDQNGNHVVQKAIECVPTQHVMHIIDSFVGSVVPLCQHPFGCRVIQRVLEHCSDVQKRQTFMDDILKATLQLAQDQYGNYVVQHVLERGTPAERHEVVRLLAQQIVPLSQHKFASNVVEKCLEHAGPAERQLLLAEMLRGGDQETGEEEPLQALMKDQFANYVVQKLLEVCDEEQREVLLSRIRAHLHTLRKFTFGKHIVTRVEKLLATGTRMQTTARRERGDEHGQLMP